MNAQKSYAALVTAAGSGTRTGLAYNKVFHALPDGKTVLEHACAPFLADPDCIQLVITASDADHEAIRQLIPQAQVVCGGSTRQESVRKGLDQVRAPWVLIHDGARPYLSQALVEKVKEKRRTGKAALLMIPSTDTLKTVKDGLVQKSLDRTMVWQAQTPQAFATDLIKACHAKAKEKGIEATDDAQLVEWFSDEPVQVAVSDPANRKITTPADLP